MASGLITSWQIEGQNVEAVTDFIFLGSKTTAGSYWCHEIKRCLFLGRKPVSNLDSVLKSFANKGMYSQSYGFSSSHTWMWELNHKEVWMLKNWCFQSVVLEKTPVLKSSLDCKEIKQVNPKAFCQHPLDHQKKQDEFQKNIYFCFIDYAKAFDYVDHNQLWKILKEMGIPDHLTGLLRNLKKVRKQQLELDMEQQTGSK